MSRKHVPIVNLIETIGTDGAMRLNLSPANRLLLVAGTLVAGEACGFALHKAAVLWPWLAFLFGLALLAAYGWGARRLLLPAVFAIGTVLAARTEAARLHILDATRFIAVPPPMAIRVESPAQLWRTKRQGVWSADFLSHLGPLPIKAVVFLNNGDTPPAVGETWVCSGRLSCKGEATDRHTRPTLWVLDPAKARRIKAASVSTAAWYMKLGRRLAKQVSLGLSWIPEVAALNRAILLGQRAGLSRARRDTFAAAGTVHVFAISGLHVMVIALVLNKALARLDVPETVRGLVTLPALAAYVMLTGMRPSAVRAAMMLAIYLLAPVFGRRPNARAAWSITALAVYGHSPEHLFDLGCALSFAVMFGIVLWIEWSHLFVPLAAPGTKRRNFFQSLGISFAAWVAGVPIVAHAFGQFSVGGLLANMVVIYCAGWMVRCGICGLAASFFCTPLAVLANNLSALFTSAMVFVTERVAAFPFARIETPFWTIWHTLAWYTFWGTACLAVGRIFPRHSSAPKPWWT